MTFLGDGAKKKIGFYYVMDKVEVSSVFGKEIFAVLKPINSKEKLLDEYENIEECINKRDCLQQFENVFMRFRDIKNTFKRSKIGEVLNEVELFEI